MPRILFIVNSLNPGGAERHVVSLVNHLDSREFPVTLAYLHPGEALLSEIRADRRAAVISCLARRKLDLRVVRRLADQVDHDDVDVIYCTNLFSMLYGVAVRARSKRRPRLVVAFHTTLSASVNFCPMTRQVNNIFLQHPEAIRAMACAWVKR